MNAQPMVAVIGSGYWGKNLIRVFDQLGALAAICDTNETLLADFKARLPHVDASLAVSDILARPDVQAVVVATPVETHHLLAREALLAGKHVFVEKPLVLHESEALELIRLAEASGRTLMVGHLLQYHPAFVALRGMAAGGALGRINYIYSHRLNLGKIRREENILWSFAPHDISMILSLAGEEPASVLATGGSYLHKSIADVTTTHMEFASGLKAHVFVSWLHPFKEQKLVVVGDKRMAVFDDTLPWPDKLLLYPHHIRWENNVPVPERAEPERPKIPEQEPLEAECRHFLDCVAHGRTPLTDGREGLRVLKVLNMSQRSLDAGGRRLPADPGPEGRDGAFVHETAVVDENAVIGAGSKVWHFSHLMPGCRIGERVTIGQNVVVGPDVTVGSGCKIQNNVSLYKGVTLEEDVFVGPSAVFTNVHNPRAHIRRMDELRPTLVCRGATIGANATIVCGVRIGRYAFVGAGAVVTRDVPDHALVVGNPARRTGWMCKCANKLDADLVCPVCEKRFALDAGTNTPRECTNKD